MLSLNSTDLHALRYLTVALVVADGSYPDALQLRVADFIQTGLSQRVACCIAARTVDQANAVQDVR